MGMGHVPSGQIPRARASDDIPRRQRGGARAPRALDLGGRVSLGRFGEALADWYLTQHGLVTRARNLVVGSGEVDIVCEDGRSIVAVEVRTRSNADDPIDAVGTQKRRKVASLAAQVGADRVDVIGIGLHRSGVDIHWVPDAV